MKLTSKRNNFVTVLNLESWDKPCHTGDRQERTKARLPGNGECKALGSSIEAHMSRTSAYSLMISDSLCLGTRERQEICLAASLHDIGKLGISEKILSKPAKLEPSEFQQIRRHPEIGESILRSFKEFLPILPLVRHHHERFDGNGYPSGLSGKEIPLGARVIAIADAFDVMISDRPYKKGGRFDTAFEELLKCANSQFDLRLVENFSKSFHQRNGLC